MTDREGLFSLLGVERERAVGEPVPASLIDHLDDATDGKGRPNRQSGGQRHGLALTDLRSFGHDDAGAAMCGPGSKGSATCIEDRNAISERD
jgi:hypothetical protein